MLFSNLTENKLEESDGRNIALSGLKSNSPQQRDLASNTGFDEYEFQSSIDLVPMDQHNHSKKVQQKISLIGSVKEKE